MGVQVEGGGGRRPWDGDEVMTGRQGDWVVSLETSWPGFACFFILLALALVYGLFTLFQK